MNGLEHPVIIIVEHTGITNIQLIVRLFQYFTVLLQTMV